MSSNFIDGKVSRSADLYAATDEICRARKILYREFSQTVGRRTFTILKTIGQAEKRTFLDGFGGRPSSTVRTSNQFSFQIPNDDRRYSVQAELKHGAQRLLPGFTPSRTYMTTLRFMQHGDQPQVLVTGITNRQFESAFAHQGEHYMTPSIPEHHDRLLEYMAYLMTAEKLVAGVVPAERDVFMTPGAILALL